MGGLRSFGLGRVVVGAPQEIGGAFSKSLILLAALVALSACTAPVDQASDQDSRFLEDVSEKLVALAAPYQDLQAVQLRPDGCYWYRYLGPVETTMLPLRTVDGRPICNRPRGAPPTAG